MDDKTRGLYQKYIVLRTDGADEMGGKHENCDHFVLDATHDPFALPALAAYAEACEHEYPSLARDIRCTLIDRYQANWPRSNRPIVVCLCGSTRFWGEFQQASLRETMAGRIVLSIGAASGTDDDHFGNLPREEYERIKTMLDELHKRKIDLANEILVLNVGGYIGDSTRSEIDYARAHGKRIRWLEPPTEAGQ